MSDALTDMTNDQRIEKEKDNYLRGLVSYLHKPTKKGYDELKKLAENVDCILGRYFGSRTNISETLEENLKRLEEGDRRSWAKLLSDLQNDGFYNIFKFISPFKEEMLLFVDYGSGFVSISGLEDFIKKVIEVHDCKTYDCDKYILAVPKLEGVLKDSEVVWINCGILGINGPRNKKGEPKKY